MYTSFFIQMQKLAFLRYKKKNFFFILQFVMLSAFVGGCYQYLQFSTLETLVKS